MTRRWRREVKLMLPVETLTFTKEQRTLPCKIVRMQQDDLDREKNL